MQEGLLPFPLKYPTIIGLSFSGIVVKVGSSVARFKLGDRVVTNSAGTIRNDSRFGAYQKYALTTQELIAKIGDEPFETAASVSNLYGDASALFLHFHLEKPSQELRSEHRAEKILIWGASSSFGAYATQLAAEAGYAVVGVASAQNIELVQSFGAAQFVDRKSPAVFQEVVAMGPYKAVLAAADTAHDQVVIGSILVAQGGGSFISTMGLRPGVILPSGVRCQFHQFIDDYLDLKNEEFTKWLWWQYLENAVLSKKLVLFPVQVVGGLSGVQAAWDLLKQGKVSGQRLLIAPNVE